MIVNQLEIQQKAQLYAEYPAAASNVKVAQCNEMGRVLWNNTVCKYCAKYI